MKTGTNKTFGLPFARLSYRRVVSRLVMGTLLLFVLASSISSANGLSKQDLIDMRQAGVDAAGIVKLVSVRGLSFSPTPRDLLDLKTLGFDASVINALVAADAAKAPSGTPSGSPSFAPSSAYHAAADLYRAGKYAEAVDTLESHLSSEPADHVSRALLATTYLRLHKRDLASRELEHLRAAGPHGAAAAASAANLLQGLIAAYDSQEALKEGLKAALQNYRVAEALAVLDRMKLGDLQRQVLRAYIALYQASFDEAKKILADVRPARYGERKRVEELQASLSEWEQSFVSTSKQIDTILYSGVANSDWCDLPFPGKSPTLVEDYLKFVQQAVNLAPLHPRVQDLEFHAGAIALEYPALESLGDRLLAAKGEIRIPGYARDRFFYLVIDKAQGKILTSADPQHAYMINCVVRGWGSAHMSCDKGKKSNVLADLEPFDLKFAEITRLEQKVQGNTGGFGMGEFLAGGPGKVARAFKFEPRGCVPEWSLMNVIHSLYGPRAQKRTTQNLGRFILHVAGNKNIVASLADPGKTRGGGLETVAGMALGAGISVAGARYGNAGLQELGKQTIQDVQDASTRRAADQKTMSEHSQVWFSALAAKSMHFFEDAVYGDIEKLLQLVN